MAAVEFAPTWKNPYQVESAGIPDNDDHRFFALMSDVASRELVHQVEAKLIHSTYYSRTMTYPMLQRHARLFASVPRASAVKTKIIQHVSSFELLTDGAAPSEEDVVRTRVIW
jgi:hypothetical protein